MLPHIISQARILAVLCLLATAPAHSQPLQENLEWDKIFAGESVQGVFVLCKGSASSCATNNKARALKAFIPASTFKIPNALISLDAGVIKDEYQVFKWDGKPRVMKQWEQDLTLRTAMQVSAVPVFQQFARELGEKRMQAYLDKLAYGNADIGGGIDRFWLDGKLRISAQGQVELLESLYLNKLPFSKVNQLIVKQALVVESKPEYILYAKTGLSGFGSKENPGVAWWVGWVEKGAEVYFFAFNMDIVSEGQLPARKSIATKIMLDEGILLPIK